MRIVQEPPLEVETREDNRHYTRKFKKGKRLEAMYSYKEDQKRRSKTSEMKRSGKAGRGLRAHFAAHNHPRGKKRQFLITG